MDKLKTSGEAITPKVWKSEADRLTAEKDADYLKMRAMREAIKAIETLRKTVERLAKEGQVTQREDLALATKLVYAVLLDRSQLSHTNGWADSSGQIYIVFPITEIANTIDSSSMTVKNALNELETDGLIERHRRGQSQPNRIYVKIPDGQDIVRSMGKKLSARRTENYPFDRQKIVH